MHHLQQLPQPPFSKCQLITHPNVSHKLASEMEVAEVRASAELELQARLLEAAQADLSRREAALSQREAAALEQERAAREALTAAAERQQQDSGRLAEAEAQSRATQQQAQQVGTIVLASA